MPQIRLIPSIEYFVANIDKKPKMDNVLNGPRRQKLNLKI